MMMHCFLVLQRNKHVHMHACAQGHINAHEHRHACTQGRTHRHTRMHARTHTHTDTVRTCPGRKPAFICISMVMEASPLLSPLMRWLVLFMLVQWTANQLQRTITTSADGTAGRGGNMEERRAGTHAAVSVFQVENTTPDTVVSSPSHTMHSAITRVIRSIETERHSLT